MKIKDPYAEFQHEKLENGLSIYHIKTDDNFIFASINIHSGASSDPIGKEGMAHFVEHMVSNNAFISGKELKEFFNQFGGNAMLGMTYTYMTRYSFKIPLREDLLRSALFLFGGMLCEGDLVNGLEKERQIIINEYKRKYKVQEFYELYRSINSIVFPETSSSRALSSLGNLDFIKSVELSELNNFFTSHYIPKNMSIVSCGNISVQKMLEIVKDSIFGKGADLPIELPNSDLVKKILKKSLHPREYENPIFEISVSKVLGGDSRMTSAKYESFAIVPPNTERSILAVTSLMLSKALFENIREKETQTYDINCKWIFNGEARWVEIGCGSFDLNYYDKIIDKIRDVIENITDDEVLFQSVCKKLISSLPMTELVNTDIVVNASKEIVLYDKIVTFREDIDAFKSIKMEDVQNVLQYMKGNFLFHVLSKP